ncbi:MAG: hypothetical protein WCZ10_14100 [Desulfobulbaceae bacterium]
MLKFRHLTQIFILLLLASFLGACASNYKPVPAGDKLLWSSDDNRPGWTVTPPDVDAGESHVFVGQSLLHGTERAARTNAEVDASAQAASFLSRQVKRQYTQNSSGGTVEKGIQNLNVDVQDQVELSADQIMDKLSVEEWYLEHWQQGKEKLWKAFVRVRLPKSI